MWANAQRDGCPAEYGWRPLFNVPKFWLTPTTRVSRSNTAKTLVSDIAIFVLKRDVKLQLTN